MVLAVIRRTTLVVLLAVFSVLCVFGLLLLEHGSGLRGIWELREALIHANKDYLEARLQNGVDRIRFDVSALWDPNPSGFPEIDLFIRPADLRRLDVLVKGLGEDGILQSDAKRWFPATVVYQGKSFSSRARIRGDQSVHWFNKKKSWRLSFKKENLFHHRRSINLIIPSDKMLEVEEAAYRIARGLGLLVPDSGFMWVRQNHVDMGLYLWVEQVDKYLLERKEYPEGEVFGGDDIAFERTSAFERATGQPANHDFNPASYKTFIHKESEVALGAQKRWHEFLELLSTRDRTLIDSNIGRYLAVGKFAKWYAFMLVFGTVHAQTIDNLKWFYDPTTGLFEPILYDVALYSVSPPEVERDLDNEVIKSILLSPATRLARARAVRDIVRKVSATDTLKSVYQSIEPYLFRGVEPFDMELPGVGRFSVRDLHYTHEGRAQILDSNISSINDWLSSHRVFIEANYQTYADHGILAMEIFPQGVASVILQDIEIAPVASFSKTEPDVSFVLREPGGNVRELAFEQLESSDGRLRFRFSDAQLVLPFSGNLTKEKALRWSLVARIGGLDQSSAGSIPALVNISALNGVTEEPVPPHRIRSTPVASEIPTGVWFVDTKDGGNVWGETEDPEVLAADDPVLSSFLATSRLPFQVSGDELVLPAGHYEVSRTLVLPRDYSLTLESGVRLLLGPNVNILAFAPVRFTGTKTDSVVIDQLVPGSPWGAIGVVNARKPSTLEYVTLRGGGAGTKTMVEGIYLTGQLNFYSSPIDIDHCRILESEGEDGLIVKKGRFSIENTVLSGHRADAFDGDWVTGSVVNSRFTDNGNDGIDLSGARVLIQNTVLKGMGDKAVSVGEQSNVDMVNCRVEDSFYGVTAKDLSLLRVYASSISGNRYGIAAYRKKPLFGGGSIEVFGGLLWNNNDDFYMDTVSTALLSGVVMADLPRLATVAAKLSHVAVIDELYTIDSQGNPIPTDLKRLPHNLAAGPPTAGKSVIGSDLPDLARYPVGMLEPLGNAQ